MKEFSHKLVRKWYKEVQKFIRCREKDDRRVIAVDEIKNQTGE